MFWNGVAAASRRLGVLITTMVALLAAAPPSIAAAPDGGVQFSIIQPEARNEPAQLAFKPVCNARLDGVIWGADPDKPDDKGDAARLAVEVQEFYKEAEVHGRPRRGEYYALCLSSPGGDLVEAVKIASVFAGWMMVIEDGSHCESACSIVFMSAAARDRIFLYEENAPGRFLHYRGKLGFHAPELNFTAGMAKGLSPEQVAGAAKTAYRNALQRMQAVAFPNDRRVQLGIKSFMGSGQKPNAMPPDLMMSFMTVPHEEMFHVSSLIEAMSWGIEIYGFELPPVLPIGMLTSACINVATVRCLYSPDNECLSWLTRLSGPDRATLTEGEIVRNTQLTFNAIALYFTMGQDVGISDYRGKGPLVPKINASLPKSGVAARRAISSEAFEFVDSGGNSMCDIRATWQGQRLTSLHLDLVAFKVPGQRVLVAPLAVPDMDPGNISRFHLRPWRMIPPNTTLDALDRPDLWQGLVDSGNFFTKPPNW